MRRLKTFLMVVVLVCVSSTVKADITEYTLTFEGRWTSSIPRPGSAHFSPFIGSTHQSGGSFMAVGQSASTGVENVAEVGSTAALISEINSGITAGTANSLITRPGNIGAEQTFSINISVDSSHSMISLITMIAPSPDWFVGVHDLDLQDSNGQWISQIVMDLNSYDAGTENGTGFSTNNSATVPRGVITALDVAEPGGQLFGAGSIARITLVRSVPEPGSMALLSVAGIIAATRRVRRVG